jgi:hypothetical protein
LNAWIGLLFSRGNVGRTVAALVASQSGGMKPSAHEAAKERLAAAESRLKRFRMRPAAGIGPGALVDVINEAQAQRAAARVELDAPAPTLITDAEIYAMIDAEPGRLERSYRDLGLGLRYEPRERAVEVLLALRVVNGRVRGPSRGRIDVLRSDPCRLSRSQGRRGPAVERNPGGRPDVAPRGADAGHRAACRRSGTRNMTANAST